MTVRRDLYAAAVTVKLQCDGPGGALVDHSRNARAVDLGDFVTDASDPLFGVNSFTGHPQVPGGSVFDNKFTIEGWARLAPNGATQTLCSAMSTTYSIPTEMGLALAGSNARQMDFYHGVRGQSEIHAQPILGSDFPGAAAGFRHFFFSSNGAYGWWFGIDGVMSAAVSSGYISDHIGAANIPLFLNRVDPALLPDGQVNAGKLHSLMITSGINRYAYNASGVYTKPDDLLTNWYNDTGAANDPADVNELNVPGRPTVVKAGRAFRNGYQKIAGHVTYSGANARKRVALYHRGTGAQLDVTYSRAADGYFEFAGLEPSSEYFVLGFDDTPGTINAEIADHLIPA